jgi:hypothetical protein
MTGVSALTGNIRQEDFTADWYCEKIQLSVCLDLTISTECIVHLVESADCVTDCRVCVVKESG